MLVRVEKGREVIAVRGLAGSRGYDLLRSAEPGHIVVQRRKGKMLAIDRAGTKTVYDSIYSFRGYA